MVNIIQYTLHKMDLYHHFWRENDVIPKTVVLGVTYNLEKTYLGLENDWQY